MKNKLLITSFLPIWDFNKGGTAARFEIAEEYSKNGYEVVYLFINYPVSFHDNKSESDKVVIKSKNINKFKYVEVTIPQNRFTIPLDRTLRGENKKFSSLAWKISIIGKVRTGEKILKKWISKYGKPDIVYSVGSDMVLSTSKYCKENKIFHISRFLGTYLGGIVQTDKAKAIFSYLKGIYPEIRGFKADTDLTVIDDDGTKGDLVYQKLGLDENKLIFWRDGIDITYTELSEDEKSDLRKTCGIDTNKRVFLLASRIADWKRLDRLISCIHSLSTDLRNNISVLVLGDGPMLEEIMHLSNKMNTSDTIRFMGMVPSDDVFKYLQISDFFISFQDVTNVGNNVLQAVSAGVPLMLTNSGNTENFINGNDVGYIFDPKTIENEFEKAVRETFDNPSIYIAKKNNIKKFKDKVLWNWEDRMKKEIDIVRGLVDEKYSDHNPD
jgi:glycosyltransferase involved in cell wall biosynthesis